MNDSLTHLLISNLETEIEEMELRILESVWALERAIIDQMEILKTFRSEIRCIKNQIELQQLQNLDQECLTAQQE